MTDKNLAHRFEYHPPSTDKVKDKHQRVRDVLLAVATMFDEGLTDSREKALAITKLEEAMFWANADIARNQ